MTHWLNKKQHCFFVLLISVSILGFSPFTIAQTEEGALPAPKGLPAVYYFHQHLSDAETFILSKGKKPVRGIWQQDRFHFQGYDQETRIRTENHIYAGMTEEGIYFHPLKNATRRIRFPQVPPGRFMLLEYGIDDTGVDRGTDTSSVYMRIWVGKHPLERILVSNEKGWKRQRIDLGIVSFLKRDVPITIEVNTDHDTGRRLSFRAEIHQ